MVVITPKISGRTAMQARQGPLTHTCAALSDSPLQCLFRGCGVSFEGSCSGRKSGRQHPLPFFVGFCCQAQCRSRVRISRECMNDDGRHPLKSHPAFKSHQRKRYSMGPHGPRQGGWGHQKPFSAKYTQSAVGVLRIGLWGHNVQCDQTWGVLKSLRVTDSSQGIVTMSRDAAARAAHLLLLVPLPGPLLLLLKRRLLLQPSIGSPGNGTSGGPLPPQRHRRCQPQVREDVGGVGGHCRGYRVCNTTSTSGVSACAAGYEGKQVICHPLAQGFNPQLLAEAGLCLNWGGGEGGLGPKNLCTKNGPTRFSLL